jgi:hypothetical protein
MGNTGFYSKAAALEKRKNHGHGYQYGYRFCHPGFEPDARGKTISN